SRQPLTLTHTNGRSAFFLRLRTEEACRALPRRGSLAGWLRLSALRPQRCLVLGATVVRLRDVRQERLGDFGTIFEGTRLPLLTWFRAIWFVSSQKTAATATTSP